MGKSVSSQTPPQGVPQPAPDIAPIAVALRPWLTLYPGPGQGAFYGVSLDGLANLAQQQGCGIREAMCLCLHNSIWPTRFKANRGVLSAAEQCALLESCVAVIGCGGLGGHLLLLLARMGIGALIVCDHDSFDESNLNRQALCREDRIGMNKALAARDELALVASHVAVTVWPEAATPLSLPDMLRPAQLVADCLDNISTRRMVEQAALTAGIPFVHGAIAGYEGFATVCRPSLADAPSPLSILYGNTPILPQGQTPGLAPDLAPSPAPAERSAGTPPPTPMSIAALQCLLVVNELLAPGSGAAPLWHLDLTVPSIESLFL